MKKRKHNPYKKFFTKFIQFTLLLSIFLFTTGIKIYSQEMIDWIDNYSTKEYENYIQKDTNADKLYFYWQIESLKRSIAPRYIRMLEVDTEKIGNKLINRGILFTYNGLKSSTVSLCGNFNIWRCVPMSRNRYGIYYLIQPIDFLDKNRIPERSYLYKFKVDGLFEYDPENQNKIDDGEGSYISEYVLERYDLDKQAFSVVHNETIHKDLDFRIVEFKIYKPNATMIAVVGNFNYWNPENDYLTKDENGFFILKKKLLPGEYYYNFIVDGQKILDTFNSETKYREDTDELASYLYVEDDSADSSLAIK